MSLDKIRYGVKRATQLGKAIGAGAAGGAAAGAVKKQFEAIKRKMKKP